MSKTSGRADAEPMVTRALNGGYASARYRELAGWSNKQLDALWRQASPATVNGMVDWEYIGWNTSPPGVKLVKLQKFSKGLFVARSGDVYGYNTPLVQNGLSDPWIAKPNDANPDRWRFYKVEFGDPLGLGKEAMILNYGRGGNGPLRIYNRLLNYIVRVNQGSDELLLGRAMGDLGPLNFRINFFLLERHRRVRTRDEYLDR
jgi:hypothetical protein